MITHLVLACLVSAAGGDYDKLLADAVRARGEGRLEESLDLLRKAQAIQPSPGLQNNIARVLEELGRWTEAVDQYRAVAADPEADRELREKDDQRIAELAPKLLYAWITFDLTPSALEVFLDGARIEPKPKLDHRAEPGRRTVEAHLLEERAVVLSEVNAPAGRRTKIARDLRTRSPEEATIQLGAPAAEVEALVIDRYRVRSRLQELSAIHLPAGRHELMLELSGTRTASRSVELSAGTVFSLGSVLTEIPSAEGNSWWPLALGSTGVVAAGVGAALLIVADNHRSEIRNAARDGEIITGITLARATDLEDSARTESTAGGVLLGVGSAVIAGAVIAWLVQ